MPKPRSLFASALALLGLSQSEAAAFLGVSRDSVRSWSVGRNPVPSGVWSELHALASRQMAAARSAVEQWETQGRPSVLTPRIEGAWPSSSVRDATLGLVWAMAPGEVQVAID